MMGANSETQLSENQLSDEQSRSVAAIVREELARRRISRQYLAEMAKISISTLEKALSGRRRDAMGRLDTLDLLHHLVGSGIDHVNAVTRAVGDVDQRGAAPGGRQCGRERRKRRGERKHEPEAAEGASTGGHGILLMPRCRQAYAQPSVNIKTRAARSRRTSV
jgi:transcriptional regulator with XRE-family HTH domain